MTMRNLAYAMGSSFNWRLYEKMYYVSHNDMYIMNEHGKPHSKPFPFEALMRCFMLITKHFASTYVHTYIRLLGDVRCFCEIQDDDILNF